MDTEWTLFVEGDSDQVLCFREYETGLHSYSKSYRLPNPKARIYAYCEALSIEPHHSKRDYSDPLYWVLNASALEPLKQFLLDLQAD